MALDAEGNLYIGEMGRIRKFTARTGIISSFAGINVPNYSGDGGPAASAAIAFPESMVFDSSGNLYIADPIAKRVRKVDAKTGIITTVAGNGASEPRADGVAATSLALDPANIASIPPATFTLWTGRATVRSVSGKWRRHRNYYHSRERSAVTLG